MRQCDNQLTEQPNSFLSELLIGAYLTGTYFNLLTLS
uniref:Uncharacterized protein n=1 Tax=Rhizophora mucronata TaxID=61149 RepID=A0A2P2NUG1_RHIMU